jgi:hypothetical protein
MDRYLSKGAQKIGHEFTKLGPAVCVMGKSGIGKTWTVRKELMPCIELTSDVLKSKQDTIDFLNKIHGTNTPVILDEYECIYDLVGLREITRPPTNGLFVVISQIPCKFNFEINTYNFPVPDPDAIRVMFPEASERVIATCRGDLRWVQQSLTFTSDIRDDFMGPREFVTSLVSRSSTCNPVDYIGHPIQEPGNIASILHENYPDSKGVLEVISNYLSVADVIETRVYAGDWELLSYFNLWGCILPSNEINHTLGNKLRPGSTWTKYQNMCMRQKKIQSISTKVPRRHLDIDALLLIRSQVEHGDFAAFVEYDLIPADLDTLNHLSPFTKLKAKTISILKKQCADAIVNHALQRKSLS